MTEFQAWPKTPRLTKCYMSITEKIDGTNAQIEVLTDGTVLAGSRTRYITPEDDNFGFARWVKEHETALRGLGIGRHYGEWWGLGIQRGYLLDHKRFSLFDPRPRDLPPCVSQVPWLYSGAMLGSDAIEQIYLQLQTDGSSVAPGFMRPEGIIVRVDAQNYKVTDK